MAFTMITVTRSYRTPAGYPAQGTVTFTPSAPMVNSNTTIASSEQDDLDNNGALSITLAANNDPSTTPVGTSYQVQEFLTGQDTRTYNVVIPYNAAGGTVNLATLAPVTVTAPAVQYVSSVNGQSGAVTIAAATDATTGAKGVARILGGTADAPTVPWGSLTGVDADLTGLAALGDGFPSRTSGTWAARSAGQLLSDIGAQSADADLTGLAGLGDGFPSRVSGTWSARSANQLLGDISAQPLATLLTRLSAAAVNITYAATITPDASQSCTFYCTATGDITVSDITNGINGQPVYLRITASGAARVLTITGVFTYTIPSGQNWIGRFQYDPGLTGFVLTQ